MNQVSKKITLVCFLNVQFRGFHVLLYPGLPGADAHVPRLSFSAALTVPMEKTGTIIFDKVFVNEGDFYDPKTGMHEQVLISSCGQNFSPAPLQ